MNITAKTFTPLAPGCVSISTFQPSQTTEVGNLIVGIQRDEYNIPITLEQQPDLADISAYYQKAKGNFWVACSQDRVVGTVALLDIDNNQAALRKMFVAPDFRGSAHGTAKKLLDESLTWAKQVGLKEIFLGTTSKFLAAHRFYEKNNFQAVPRECLPAKFPIMAVDSVFYMLSLEQST